MSIEMPIIGSISGETYHIIKKSNCGLVSDAENKLKLFKNIKKVINMKNLQLKNMGNNGLNYYMKNFNKKNTIKN